MAHKARRRRSLRRIGRRNWYAAVYLCDLAYGGPEEGGWYYGTSEPVSHVRRCKTQPQASRMCDRLDALICDPENIGRPSVSSVLSRGRYSASWTWGPPRATPTTRPHYE